LLNQTGSDETNNIPLGLRQKEYFLVEKSEELLLVSPDPVKSSKLRIPYLCAKETIL